MVVKPKRIRLFVKPYCGWCHKAVRWLDDQGVEYQTVDVIADEIAYDEMIRLSGQDLAPVLDLELFDVKTDNALRERCWGRTADEVSRWAGGFLEGLEREGVAACPKHFPGLGGAALDSHEKLPTIERTREQLLAEDVVPYLKLMRRLTAIMVGHGHYPAFDGKKPRPASVSKAIVTELLRNQLGFGGLVLTDDMEMGAISQIRPFQEAVVDAFDVGADMILVCHTAEKALAAHEALTKAVESGRIRPQRLAQSQQRMRQFRDEWIAHKV